MSNKRKIGVVILSILKVIVPVSICIGVVAMIVSVTMGQKEVVADDTFDQIEMSTEPGIIATPEPLEKNKIKEVNSLFETYYNALANGDTQTLIGLRDDTSETDLIKIKKKSEFIESYSNIDCYTKPGLVENSYFVYVVYDLQMKEIDVMVPGLNSWYVFPNADGKLIINIDQSESVSATFAATSNNDDVVDLFNKVDAQYREIVLENESFMEQFQEIQNKVNDSVSIEIAKMQIGEGESASEQENNIPDITTDNSAETDNTETKLVEYVNQKVKTTDTVNVRSSDSETADKVGKATKGMKLTRTEIKINGWSKVIFNNKEAFIKSDYLELVEENGTDSTTNPNAIGTVKAKSNVNVRSKADSDAERIGMASEGSVYSLLEDLGEWYKIDYKGKEGFVKSEFFTK